MKQKSYNVTKTASLVKNTLYNADDFFACIMLSWLIATNLHNWKNDIPQAESTSCFFFFFYNHPPLAKALVTCTHTWG